MDDLEISLLLERDANTGIVLIGYKGPEHLSNEIVDELRCIAHNLAAYLTVELVEFHIRERIPICSLTIGREELFYSVYDRFIRRIPKLKGCIEDVHKKLSEEVVKREYHYLKIEN